MHRSQLTVGWFIVLFFRSCYCQVSSNLPIIVIETEHEIVDEPKREGFMTIFHRENATTNSLTDTPYYQHKIGIEKRGESSLLHPKNSFGFELWDELSDQVEDSIFGLPAESDWVLYGPYTDRSFMRNHLAYTLTRQIGRWTTHTVFVELFIHNSSTPLESLTVTGQEYRGIYVFMEKLKRSPGRISVEKLQPHMLSEEEITGGYILETGVPDGNRLEILSASLIYPKNAQDKNLPIVEPQQNYIRKYMEDTDTALRASDFMSEARFAQGNHYAQFIDGFSFIDFWIVQEFTNNPDAYYKSNYLHKRRRQLLEAGPVWDFDIAFGWVPRGVSREWKPRDVIWYQQMTGDPNFSCRAIARYLQLRKTVLSVENIMKIVDDAAALIADAVTRDAVRWPYDSIWSVEVEVLKRFVTERLEFMDATIVDHFKNITIAPSVFPPKCELPRDSLRLTEIMVGTNEFIEIKNVGTEAVDLSGFEFRSIPPPPATPHPPVVTISYTFPPNSVIQPGSFILLGSQNTTLNHELFGRYTGNLPLVQGAVTLTDLWKFPVIHVEYNYGGKWPSVSAGYSYVATSSTPTVDQNDGTQWKQSAHPCGSPGVDDEAQHHPIEGCQFSEVMPTTHTSSGVATQVVVGKEEASAASHARAVLLLAVMMVLVVFI